MTNTLLLALVVSIGVDNAGYGGLCEGIRFQKSTLERRTLESRGANHWLWEPRPGERVLCSFPNRQPVVFADETVADAHVTLSEGSRFTVEGNSEKQSRYVIIEGLTADLRPVAIWEETGLINGHVAGPDVQYFRFYRPGVSPVTLPRGRREGQPEHYVIPATSSGGEIAGIVRKQAYMPKAIAGTCGERHFEAAVGASGFFSEAGLPPGKCRVSATYLGGIESDSTTLDVKECESASLIGWPSNGVGALSISVEKPLCEEDRSARIRVQRVVGELSVTRTEMESGSQCLHYFEGIEPGIYAVSIHTGDSELADPVTVEVEETRLAEVEIAAYPVKVSGRITVGGESIQRAMFLEFLNGDDRWPVDTTETGIFETALPRAGDFQISVRTTPYFPVATFWKSLRRGTQVVDLDLAGGAVAFTLVGENGSRLHLREPVQVVLKGPEGTKAGFLQSGEEDLAFFGLAFGKYVVKVFTATDLVSREDVEFELTEAEPSVDREIQLVKSQGRLLVTNRDGNPLRGAAVRAGMVLLTEDGPGSFPLTKVPRGESLLVTLPGYSPVCRKLSKSGDVEVRLFEGSLTSRVALDSAAAELSLGRLIGLPDCDCPVPLGLIGANVSAISDGRVLVEVHGLSAGDYEYLHPVLSGPLRVQVPGEVIEVRAR